MLPSLLNSTYDKLLRPGLGLEMAEQLSLFGDKEQIRFSDLDVTEQGKIMRLAQSGKILVDYVAKDKKQIKKNGTVFVWRNYEKQTSAIGLRNGSS